MCSKCTNAVSKESFLIAYVCFQVYMHKNLLIDNSVIKYIFWPSCSKERLFGQPQYTDHSYWYRSCFTWLGQYIGSYENSEKLPSTWVFCHLRLYTTSPYLYKSMPIEISEYKLSWKSALQILVLAMNIQGLQYLRWGKLHVHCWHSSCRLLICTLNFCSYKSSSMAVNIAWTFSVAFWSSS